MLGSPFGHHWLACSHGPPGAGTDPPSGPAASSFAMLRPPGGTGRLSGWSQGEADHRDGAVCAVAEVVRLTNEPWRAREELPPDRRAVLMKLPPVEYEAPTTVAEAIDLLAEHLDEASVLAGGQSLIPLLALRLARPEVLIDINGIDELSGVSAADGWVAIGAMTREYVAGESETVADTVPLLAAALPLIGHEAIRSRGTIGGSLAHADPAAELPAVAMALDAEFVVRGQSGERVIPAAEWFEGYLMTSRRSDELLLQVRFPAAGPGTGVSFQEVARRHGDFAIVGLAVSLVLSGGVIRDARLAFAGLSDVPVRAAAVEDLLVGERPSADLFDEAARRATDDLDPPTDLYGSSDYRKTVAAVVVRRGLRAAADNANERQ
jgi:aerobic carbon-monoxide dehydrogenase medium subunit